MAEPLISRVYDITIQGYEDSAKKLKAITAEFQKMDRLKKQLNKSLKEKVEVDDSEAVKALQDSIKDLTARMAELTTQGNAVSNEMKAMAGTTQETTSAYALLKQEYKDADAHAKEMAAQFGVQSTEAQEAAQKLALIRDRLKEINDLAKKGPQTSASEVPFSHNLEELNQQGEAIKQNTDLLSQQERQQAEAAVAAIEWAKAQKTATQETKETEQATEQALTGIERFTGSLRQNVLIHQENAEALKANKAEQKEIEKAIKGAGIATDEQKERLARLKEESILLGETNRGLLVTIKNQTREYMAGAGSMEQMQAQINQLQQAYSLLSETERQSPFGLELKKEIDTLEPKIKELEGSIGRFQRNVGNYPNAILSAFRDLGLADILKSESDKIKDQLKNLQDEAQKLAKQYKESSGTGKESFQELEIQLKENLEEQEKLRQSLGNLDQALEKTGGIGHQITQGLANGFKNLKNQLTQLLLGYIGFQAVFSAMRSGIGIAKELSDETTNLEIELGKAAGGVRHLVDELAKLNTRTKLIVLEEMANIAARAGVAEDKLVGVVEAVDKIKTAFGKDFGEVEKGTESLIKLINIFEGTENVTGDNLLKTGNAVRTLANESIASVPYLNDFSTRLAGLRGITKITLPDVLGLASGFEQFGQSSEVAGTALMKVIPQLARDTEKYAAIAGMTKEAFSELLNSNPAEALIAVSEALTKSGEGIEDIAKAFGDSELGSGRIAAVLGTLGAKADTFRSSIESAGKAYTQTGNITDAFAKKNDNLAATLDKISKKFADTANSKAFQATISAISAIILVLLNNLPALITILALYATGWAMANQQMIIARAELLFQRTILPVLTALFGGQANAMRAYAAVTALATKALNSLRLAMMNPYFRVFAGVIGLSLIAVKSFGIAINTATDAVDKYAQKKKILNEIEGEAAKAVAETKAREEALLKIIRDRTLADQVREKALDDLKKMMGEYGEALTLETILTNQGTEALKKFNEQLMARAKNTAAAAIAEREAQKLSKLYQYQDDIERARASGGNINTGQFDEDFMAAYYKKQGRSASSIGKWIGDKVGIDFSYSGKDLKAFSDLVKTQIDEQITKTSAAEIAKFETEQKTKVEQTVSDLNTNPVKVKPVEIDIAALKEQIKEYDEQIAAFKGSQAALNKLLAERKQLQTRIDNAMGVTRPGSTNRGSRLSGDQRDALRDIEARRDEQIALEKIKFSEQETSEQEYLQEVNRLNIDAANQKLALLKGTNAAEKKEIAELKLYKLKVQEDTNKELYELAKKEMEMRLDIDRGILQDQYESVKDDPTKTEQEKLQAKEAFLTGELILQMKHDDALTSLEQQYQQRRKEDVQKRGEEILRLKKEHQQNEKDLILGTLNEIGRKMDEDVSRIRLKYAKIREEILKSDKNPVDKGNAVAVVNRTENVEIKTAELKRLQETLDYAKQLLDLGYITEQQYEQIYTKAVNGQEALNNAIEQGKNQITSMKGLLTTALSDLFGFDEESGQAQLLSDTIVSVYNTAQAAMQNYYDAEANRIRQSNELNKKKLDIQLQQMTDQAQSQAEIDSLQRQFAAKKEAEDRKAFEKNKKIQLAQAKMNLAVQLSNLAVVAFAPNPMNIATLGIAGTIMYATQAALALVNYFSNVNKINSATFAKGGFTGTGLGERDKTGKKVAGVVHEKEWVSPQWMVEHPEYGPLIQELELVRKKGFASGGFTSTMAYPGANFDRLIPPVNPSSFLNPDSGNKAEIQEMRKVLADFSRSMSGAVQDTQDMVKETAESVREVSKQTNKRIDKIKVEVVSKEVEDSNNERKKASAIATI